MPFVPATPRLSAIFEPARRIAAATCIAAARQNIGRNRQRQRATGIALFLTGMGSFFGCCRRFSSCQKRRSLLRRDHSLRSGVPRGRPVPEPGDFEWWDGIENLRALWQLPRSSGVASPSGVAPPFRSCPALQGGDKK